MKTDATLTVNGTDYPIEIDPHLSLLKAVRDELGLTGSKEGCDDSECGACMMLLDGRPVNSCSYLAMQAVGKPVTTVEGLAGGEEVGALQGEFLQQGGVQCGFCTPGMLVSATALLRRNPSPTEDEVRLALAGNLCRCTGYGGIVKAVMETAAGHVAELPSPPVHESGLPRTTRGELQPPLELATGHSPQTARARSVSTGPRASVPNHQALASAIAPPVSAAATPSRPAPSPIHPAARAAMRTSPPFSNTICSDAASSKTASARRRSLGCPGRAIGSR